MHQDWHRVNVEKSDREGLLVASRLFGRDVDLHSVTLHVDHNSYHSYCCSEADEVGRFVPENSILETPQFVLFSEQRVDEVNDGTFVLGTVRSLHRCETYCLYEHCATDVRAHKSHRAVA